MSTLHSTGLTVLRAASAWLLPAAAALGLVFSASAQTRRQSTAPAQTPPQASSNQLFQPTQGQLRDRGTYHVSSNTWTRPGQGAFLGGVAPEVIFRNDAIQPYFSSAQEPRALTDEGRIPGPESEGDYGSYLVEAVTISYCSGQTSPLTANLEWYQGYEPCTDPALTGTLVGSVTVPGLNSSPISGTQFCWTVTLDFADTPDVFSMSTDGGNLTYDNDPATDSFGFRIRFTGQGLDPLTGPVVAGDPSSAPHGSGTRAIWGFPAGVGTGLGAQDGVYLEDTVLTPGCYNLGGYPSAPFASYHQVLFGRPDDGNLLDHFPCSTNPNSTGFPAHIWMSGSASVTDQQFNLRAYPVPESQWGIFFYGSNQIDVPFGNGYRCAGGNVRRMPPVLSQFNLFVYEGSDRLIQHGTVGETVMFQAWYRDTPAGGLQFNLSDAGGVTVLP